MATIKNLRLKDVKPLIGNLSRANYYQVIFGGLSDGLFKYLKQKGVNKSFIGGDAGLLCYSGTLPGSSLASVESRTDFHGITENFAHTRIYTPITLNFYCDDRYRALKFFEHWMEYVVSGNGTRGSEYSLPNYNTRLKYPMEPGDGYKSFSTKIVKFENDFNRSMEYSFIGLYPENLSSTQVQYGSNSELTRITCTFKYDRYIAGSISSFDEARGFAFNNDSRIGGLLDNIRDGDILGVLNSLIN